MQLLERDGDYRLFLLSQGEKRALTRVLRLYPLVPLSHHRISRDTTSPKTPEHQQCLEEALAALRAENRRQLDHFLSEVLNLKAVAGGFHLRLTVPQIDSLLQILNDVRVGSWLNLGSPDPKTSRSLALNPANLPHFWAMEVSGHFETEFLQALQAPG